MKVIILGASLVSGNRGVNALTRGTINSILDFNSNANIKILSYSTKKEIIHNIDGTQIHEIPFFAKKRLLDCSIITMGLKSLMKNNNVINEIIKADFILDISEGDSFSDIYGTKRFLLHSIGKYISIKYNKKLIIMPQTIGPFKNNVVKKCAKYLLNNSFYIFTRDKLSLEIVEDMKLNKNNTKCLPDMAFYMKPKENNKYNYYFNECDNVIGINISALLYNGGYNKKNMFGFKSDYKELIDQLINKIMNDKKNKILLIPHVITNIEVEDDLRVCQKVEKEYSELYGNRIYSIKEELREDELKYIISKCKFFIGARMHACIAAISTGVPSMPIAYSRKFIGIWQDIGLHDCVADPRIHTDEEILKIYDYCTNNTFYIKNKLIEKNLEYKKLINKIFEIIKF